jgi:hypothetical protein
MMERVIREHQEERRKRKKNGKGACFGWKYYRMRAMR